MKTILKSTLLLLCSVGLFTACSDDNDSNPTLGQPTTFVLNTPGYASMPVNLETSTELPFTWSSPDYGCPVEAEFQLEASINGSFTVSTAEAEENESLVPDYVALPATFTGGSGSMDAAKLAAAVNTMGNWGDDAPETVTLTVRASATTKGAATIYSNTVNIIVVPADEIAPAFPMYIYEIGNESGWGTAHALCSPNQDGIYKGFYYLDGEFKFKPNADNWDDDLEYVDGTTMGGTLTSSGGPNCPDPGAGFYRIDLDASNLSYTLKKIEYVSIIGTANGNWDTDTDLTYNKEEGCWEVTTDLNAGEMKFRGNHNWDGDVDLGGSLDNLVHGGSNIPVEAGNYTIRLFISIAGNHYCIMNKN